MDVRLLGSRGAMLWLRSEMLPSLQVFGGGALGM